MKVSVIVPVYQVEKTIVNCLKSIGDQQCYDCDIECIVVDDCGADRSISLAKEYIAKYRGLVDFKIEYREKNGGLSAARNSGLEKATGDYVTFVDSDDRLTENAIESFIKVIQRNGGIDIVQGDISVSHPSSRYQYLAISPALFPEYSGDQKWCAATMLTTMPTTAWGKMIRRDFITENNLYFVEGILHEDEMWRLQASRFVKSMGYCFVPVYYYQVDNADSIMHKKDKTRHYQSMLRIAEEVINNFNSSNAIAETMFAMNILSYSKKANLWDDVKDKAEINKTIAELSRKATVCNMNWINTLLHYLRKPEWYMRSFIGNKLYNRALSGIYKSLSE